MMERNINKKYLEIHKKKDLPGNKMSIRNRFTYYPLYDVDKNTGGAFGWIVWTAQTLLLLILGAAAFVLMPMYNRRFNKEVT